MSRPGYVLDVDRSTPPVLFHHGEGFSLERLPVGSRVVYPPEPTKALPDPDAAVRRALLEPLGTDPLPAFLRPGMRLTIAFDDVSLPLPPMKAPDNRQVAPGPARTTKPARAQGSGGLLDGAPATRDGSPAAPASRRSSSRCRSTRCTSARGG